MKKRHVAWCAILAACGDIGAEGDVTVSIVQRAEVAPATVVYAVSNGFDESIHVSACGDRIRPGLESRVDGEWQFSSPGICQANVSSVPREVTAGAAATDSVHIQSPGEYRLRIGFGRGNLRILYMRVSQPFTLR